MGLIRFIKNKFNINKKSLPAEPADVEIDEDAHRDFKCWMRKLENGKNKGIENLFKHKP